LKEKLGMEHPNLRKFIKSLRKVQKGRDIFLEQIIAGHEPPAKRKKYIDCDKRIVDIVSTYKKENMIQYLPSVVYNLHV